MLNPAACDVLDILPGLEQLASLHLPQSQRVVGATRGEEGGGRVDVYGPESTLMLQRGSAKLKQSRRKVRRLTPLYVPNRSPLAANHAQLQQVG